MPAPRLVQVGANPIIAPPPQANNNAALSQALLRAGQNQQFTPGANNTLEGISGLGKTASGALIGLLGERKDERRREAQNRAIASIIAQKNAETARRDGTQPFTPQDQEALQGQIQSEQEGGNIILDPQTGGAGIDNSELVGALQSQFSQRQANQGQPQMSPQDIAQALNSGVPPQLLIQQGQPQVDPNTQARITSQENIARFGQDFKEQQGLVGFKQQRQLLADKADFDTVARLEKTIQDVAAAAEKREFTKSEAIKNRRARLEAARAGRSSVNVNVGEESGTSKAIGKGLGEGFIELGKDAETAEAQNSQLEVLKNIDLDTGPGTQFRLNATKLLSAVGIKKFDKFLTSGAQFQSLVMKDLLSTLAKQKGPQTEGDAERALKSLANLGNTPPANRFIISFNQAMNNRVIARRDFFENYWVENGNLRRASSEWGKVMPSLFADPVMDEFKALGAGPKGLDKKDIADRKRKFR